MKKLTLLLVATLCVMFIAGCGTSALNDDFQKLDDLNKPEYTVAAVVGAASEPYIGERIPNAVEKQFPTVSDMIIALQNKQVDAIVYTRATLEAAAREKPDEFHIVDEPLGQTEIHMVISKKTKLKNLAAEVNEFLGERRADGTIEKVRTHWVVEHKTDRYFKPEELNKPRNKKLVVGSLYSAVPLAFYTGDKLTGFDVDLIELFADEYGYEIEYRTMDITPLLAAAEFGQIDMISGSIMRTPEREERVIFPNTPLYTLPISAMTRKNADTGASVAATIDNLKTSFDKALIKEDRYKMIVEGLKVTLIISVGALILGTVLGFILCMMKRSSVKIVSKLTEAFIALISGLPVVLTLMICFYVIFASAGLSAIVVSIIAFAVDFGCYAAIILNSGIKSVAMGEIEAAAAIGMSKLQIFRVIVFPQAAQKIFGVYRRQVISLVKSTSVVGYIAVQDLTKVSDIIRSRTFDAFFSLILTAAMYFILARLCIFALDILGKKFNRRKDHD